MSIWLPLESNPEVLTKYIHELGVPKSWALTDVIGLDPELLEFVPKPVKSIILLFPCSPKYEEHRAKEHEQLVEKAQEHPENLFYMRQFTHNACGTVAVIHSLANAKDIPLGDGVLKSFLESSKSMNPEERGKALEKNETFSVVHETLAQEGQTAAVGVQVNHHFVSLINFEGVLYELDGRKSFPVTHGETSDETFLQDAARVCKEFMARDPEEVRFNILALVPAQD